MSRVAKYRDLDMWKLSMELCELVYKVTTSFPRSELYGLISQLRRASVSIASNIAEGFSRRHSKEKRQFLSITHGSLSEVETQIELSYRLEYIPNEEKDQINDLTDHIGRMVTKFIQSLNK